MVRAARDRCESGIYRIVLRGINRQDIFYDNGDMLRFSETVELITHRKTDAEVKAEIEALMGGEPIGRLQGMDKKKRGEIINMIKQSEGVTQRQIA